MRSTASRAKLPREQRKKCRDESFCVRLPFRRKTSLGRALQVCDLLEARHRFEALDQLAGRLVVELLDGLERPTKRARNPKLTERWVRH